MSVSLSLCGIIAAKIHSPKPTGGSWCIGTTKHIHDSGGSGNHPRRARKSDRWWGTNSMMLELNSTVRKIRGSHNVVTIIQDENGDDPKTVRANIVAFKSSQNEYGTIYWLCFAISQQQTVLLENMFAGTPDDILLSLDKLTKMLVPRHGHIIFFVPSPMLLARYSTKVDYQYNKVE